MTFAAMQARPHKRRHILQSAAAFMVLAALSHFAVNTERGRMEQDLRNQVTLDALDVVSRLDAQLNANVFLANGMFTLLAAVPNADDAQLQTALQALYQMGRHVHNVGLAPDNRITQVYPLRGNEAALGLYYPDVPEQWVTVKRAMDSRATVLAGPTRLRQGGSGLVSRTPVYARDGGYWGILSLVLDADSLFKSVGLATEANGVRYALRGRDGEGEKGDVFLGSPTLFATDAVTVPFHVPGGAWVIAARPEAGWSAGQGHLALLEGAALMLALGLSLGVYSFLRGRLRIQASEQRLRAFMETARDGVIVINEHGIVLEFNHAAEQLFGYDARELLGTPLTRLMPAREAGEHDRHVRQSSRDGVRLMGGGRQIVGKRKDGGTFPAEISVGNMQIDGERIFVGVVRDITTRKEYERQLVALATTDALTQVMNRRSFLEEGNTQHQLALRHGRPLSLMMIDADHFKKVNDTYGHHVGDQVLVRLAQVAQDCLRTTDRLGRIGGEEFAVLMPETGLDQAEAVCQRLLQAVRETEVRTGADERLKFTVSIGIAAMAPDSRGLDALMRQADAALYQAKAEGRNRYRVAAPPA